MIVIVMDDCDDDFGDWGFVECFFEQIWLKKKLSSAKTQWWGLIGLEVKASPL